MYRPYIVFGPDEPVAAPPVAAAPVASEPVVPVAAPVAAPPPSDSPWAADLNATFQDETVRGQVDSFLRGHVQPHVTRIEQESAPARELFRDLQGDESVETYIGVAAQLYGDEVAAVLQATLAEKFGGGEETEPVAGEPAPMDARTAEAVAYYESRQAEDLYNSELAKAIEADPSIKGRESRFANFVVGSEGDFPEAQKRWAASRLEDQAEWAPQAPAAPAPATLTDQGAPATAPQVTQQMTIDDALEATLADMRAARGAPTPVGQV